MPERNLEAELDAMSRRMDDMIMRSMTGATTSTISDAAPKPLTLETLLEVELWALTGKTWKVSKLAPEDGYFRLPACPPIADDEWFACHPKAAEAAIAKLRSADTDGGGEGK